MNQDRDQFEACGVEQMRLRCQSLRLPTVRCGIDGDVPDDPDAIDGLGSDVIDSLLRAPELIRSVRDAALEWKDEDIPHPVSLAPGLCALPVSLTERRRRIGYLVIVTPLRDELAKDSAIERLAEMIEADAAALRQAFEPLASHPSESVPTIGALLQWLHQDVMDMDAKERAIGEFSGQLTECYEEISLLYKLGRAMTELAAPERFVEQTCDELHTTLNYKWIAAGFVSEHDLARHMAGRSVISGDPGPDGRRMRDLIGHALEHVRGDNAVVLRAEDLQRELGAAFETDVIARPVLRAGVQVGVIATGDKLGADRIVTSADLKLVDAAAGYMSIFLENARLYDDQQAMFLGTLEALTASIDAKDRYTCGHSERVAHLAVQLAERVGLDDDKTERIRICGLVHDIGKIGVPESVLSKPGRLTDEEFEHIKRHPEIGVRILKDIPQLSDVLPGVLHHHERWDGCGYPHGLSGGDIPFFARLLALADSFDAMSSTRTYRAAMPRTKVLEEIRRCGGSQFDPELAEVFVTMDFSTYERMVQSHLSNDVRADIGRGAAA